MVYTEEEKRRMDSLLKVFEDYIREQSFFDIVYSEKIGYLRISAEDPEGGTLQTLDDGEEMLGMLLNEIACGEALDLGGKKRANTLLGIVKDREEAACRMVSRLISQMEREDDKDYFLNALDNNSFFHGK